MVCWGSPRELVQVPVLATSACHCAAGKLLPRDPAAAAASAWVTDMILTGSGRLHAQVNVFLWTALSFHRSDLHLASFELQSMAEADRCFDYAAVSNSPSPHCVGSRSDSRAFCESLPKDSIKPGLGRLVAGVAVTEREQELGASG